jgi:hypothetical protein
MGSIIFFIFLTGSTGLPGFICYPHRFPDESDETQSAFGGKTSFTIKHGTRFSDNVGN